MTVDSQTLTYDAIGNPLTYYNGLLWTLTWQNGRELATAKWGTTSVSYTYDAEGVRTSKTVNGVVHNYVYLGGFLVEETWGSNILQFSYDDQNRPYSVDYNGTIYYYVLNQQGDVVQVVDANGVIQGAYVYNAWGEVLEVTAAGTIGTVNPLRYRGYYYDAETGFYYLNSRYYDPEVGRFISADTTDILTASPMALTDKNLYAYCDNNPVVRIDVTGNAWDTIFDIVSLAASVAEVMAKPSDPWAWAGLVGDVVDVALPFVTGVGEVTRATRSTVRLVSDVDDVVETAKAFRRTSEATSEVRKSTGVYVVLYEKGQNYVGKGGFGRAITSATGHLAADDRVSAIIWAPLRSIDRAFVAEYLLQNIMGVDKKTITTYNKIWSPGKSIFQALK